MSAADPPGLPPPDEALKRRLDEALAARGPRYRPRTRHVLPDGRPKYTNRLVLETSPYLLQHAHNPVAWQPWGDEAFAEARRRNAPVFLSTGYSTCHWCHVMEEESFEDEEVAAILNAGYVPIKVDREERPDVDGVYMAAVQALTGHGGWPMSVWLDHEGKPFYGGTYFPARDGDRGAQMGFSTLLLRLRELWDEDADRVERAGAELSAALQGALRGRPAGDLPGPGVLDEAVRSVATRFDPRHGGLSPAPKFPSSLPVRALLRHHLRTGADDALRMATLTLEKMAAGGLYDHVGGGFHRYSTDDRWLVPHFEKMLYDQALLVVAYVEAWQATGRALFADVARDVLAFVRREMRSEEGAFFSATDADSLAPSGEREEGFFFTWTPDELKQELGAEQARLVAASYDVTPGGNFEGRSILWRKEPLAVVARRAGVDEAALLEAWRQARPLLARARAERPAPLTDEKVIAAWNGLMISAYARAGFAFDDDELLQTARTAAAFVLDRMVVDGRLARTFKDGRARHAGTLDDHAFVCQALLDLYEATGEPRWLLEAKRLDEVLAARFEDGEDGGFFLTADDAERLLVREKPGHDGAEPSGNSVHAQNLARLWLLTTDDAYRVRAERTLRAFGKVLQRHPIALSEMLLAVDLLSAEPREVVVVASTLAEAEALVAPLRSTFLPHKVLARAALDDVERAAAAAPILAGRAPRGGAPTAWVCARGACRLPVTTAEALLEDLARRG